MITDADVLKALFSWVKTLPVEMSYDDLITSFTDETGVKNVYFNKFHDYLTPKQEKKIKAMAGPHGIAICKILAIRKHK